MTLSIPVQCPRSLKTSGADVIFVRVAIFYQLTPLPKPPKDSWRCGRGSATYSVRNAGHLLAHKRLPAFHCHSGPTPVGHQPQGSRKDAKIISSPRKKLLHSSHCASIDFSIMMVWAISTKDGTETGEDAVGIGLTKKL